jgi:hypothetical protein
MYGKNIPALYVRLSVQNAVSGERYFTQVQKISLL